MLIFSIQNCHNLYTNICYSISNNLVVNQLHIIHNFYILFYFLYSNNTNTNQTEQQCQEDNRIATRNALPLSYKKSLISERKSNLLFKNAINGYLKLKLRILVTHHIQHLNDANQILVLNNGQIESLGTFNDLSKSIFLWFN